MGPVIAAIDTMDYYGNFSDTFLNYKTGVWNGLSTSGRNCIGYKTNHHILIVGYGTENGVDYWLIKNSYGPNWGDRGRWINCFVYFMNVYLFYFILFLKVISN